MDNYPRTIKESKWKEYLGRELEDFERHILHNTLLEIRFNISKMIPLYKKLYKYNMVVPKLTELEGNCFFESLVYHGIGDEPINLRKFLAYMMYQLRDYKNIIPGQNLTPKELYQFEIYDQIEYLYCKENNKLYKNNYDIMCMDLSTPHSWSILPINLIMFIISRIFNVEIKFIKDTDSMDTNFRTINAYENLEDKPNLQTIYLGHILESHYIPIIYYTSETELTQEKYLESVLYYESNKAIFHKWGLLMENKLKEEKEKEENNNEKELFNMLDFKNIL